ncbi:MAG: hypothetical protein ABJO97_06515 [Roseibium sp.]|uniref:hypothetical protein n=1 Tax=Alphaproteobacteria TaxID=28211 RepID=UPI003298628E
MWRILVAAVVIFFLSILDSPPKARAADILSFITTSSSTCPETWVEVTQAQGRIVIGTNNTRHSSAVSLARDWWSKDDAGANQPVDLSHGSAMVYDDIALRHHHKQKGKIGTSVTSIALASGGNDLARDNNHLIDDSKSGTRRTASGKASTSDKLQLGEHGNLPITQILLCKKSAAAVILGLPVKSVSLFSTADGEGCPSGWEMEKGLNGRAPMPAPKELNGMSIGSTYPEDGRLIYRHNHTVTFGTFSEPERKAGPKVDVRLSTKDLAEAIIASTSVASQDVRKQKLRTENSLQNRRDKWLDHAEPDFPTAAFLACRKVKGGGFGSDGSAKKLPEGFSFFFSGGNECPSGPWRIVNHVRGRYLMGLPTPRSGRSAKERANNRILGSGSAVPAKKFPSHNHEIDIVLPIKEQGVAGTQFLWKKAFATPGDYKFHGHTHDDKLRLPYQVLTMCYKYTKSE